MKLKSLIIAAFLIASINSYSQRTVVDTLNKTTTKFSPMILDGILGEVVVIEKESRMLWSGFVRISGCREFKQFKKDYPAFMIPKKTSIKFSCK